MLVKSAVCEHPITGGIGDCLIPFLSAPLGGATGLRGLDCDVSAHVFGQVIAAHELLNAQRALELLLSCGIFTGKMRG